MTDYRANTEEAHKEFEKFTNKIASCVSSNDVGKITTILKVTNELVDYNNGLLSNAVKAAIQDLWTSTDLDQKLQKLHELEKENIGQAWRPETGMCNVVSIEGDHLRKLVKLLKKNIDRVVEESSQLQTELAESRLAILEQQMELMEHSI